MLHTQYSTHWDGFPHKGSLFDANGDGVAEKVYYNGFSIVDDAGRGTQGELGATNLSIAGAAETGMQARGVLVDLRHHFGDERVAVDYEMLAKVLQADNVRVEKGDILCLHTGLGQLIREARGKPGAALKTACAVMDGYDKKLLEWIADTGVAAIAADNLAVERSSTLGVDPRMPKDITERLNRELNALLKRPEVRESLAKQAFDAKGATTEEFSVYVKDQYEIWGRAIREAGIQPE